jgi:hypothetical protein
MDSKLPQLTKAEAKKLADDVEKVKSLRDFDGYVADILVKKYAKRFHILGRSNSDEVSFLRKQFQSEAHELFTKIVKKRVNPVIINVICSSNLLEGHNSTFTSGRNSKKDWYRRENKVKSLLKKVITDTYALGLTGRILHRKIIRRKVIGCLCVIEDAINKVDLYSDLSKMDIDLNGK